MYVIISILIFGVLIAIHEFGHFITAKLCGVRVLEFSIGMGPALLKKQGTETVYSLRLLPIGGFCAMEGEDSESDDPRAFSNQGRLKKILILLAGAGMNFLLGFILLVTIYACNGVPRAEITDFMDGCPYQGETALQEGDLFWEIDGHRVRTTEDVSRYLSRGGEVHDIAVKRNGEILLLEDFTITPQKYEGQTAPMYGFFFQAVSRSPLSILQYSWEQSVNFVRMVWESIVQLVSGNYGIKDLSGVVGIVGMMNDVGQQSETTYLAFLNLANLSAFIAVNLAVMNLLPIPALDGGRIFFLLLYWPIEKILGRKINPKFEQYVNSIFLIALMGLMVYLMFNDVLRIVG